MSFKGLASSLAALQSQHLHRQVVSVEGGNGILLRRQGRDYVNFSSNDYLGLASDPLVKTAAINAVNDYGIGSGGSSLVTGYSVLHQRLEAQICEITGNERAMLFSSGFAANSGVISALLSRDDLLLQDKLNHASLMEAGMQSPATMQRFVHNDMTRLNTLLDKSNHDNKLVVSEGVFSMDGDQGDLAKLSSLAKEHDSWLMVDDAHGFGINGDGRGTCAEAKITPDILMATFGKAIGTSGAFVAASSDVIDYLTNTCRHYIYSTALPIPVVAATIKSIELAQHTDKREKLAARIDYFRQQCQHNGLALMPSDSAIQPIIIGQSDKAIAMSDHLKSQGIWVSAIRPPTVPPNTARLRVTLSANHELSHIDALVKALIEAREVAND